MDFRIFLLLLVAFLATCLTQHGVSGDPVDIDTAPPRNKRQAWELAQKIGGFIVDAIPKIKDYLAWSKEQARTAYLEKMKPVWECRNKTIEFFDNKTRKLIADETEAMANGHVDPVWMVRRSIIDNSIHDYTLRYTSEFVGMHNLMKHIEDTKSGYGPKEQVEALKIINDTVGTATKVLSELFERGNNFKFFTGMVPDSIDISRELTECAAKYMFCVDDSIIENCARDIKGDYNIIVENKEHLIARANKSYVLAEQHYQKYLDTNQGSTARAALTRVFDDTVKEIKTNYVFAYAANFVSFFEASDQMYMFPLIAKRLTKENCTASALKNSKVELQKCFAYKPTD